MNCDYSDIRSRIQELPTWWDESAVPRYCEFTPEATADIYADEALLLQVRCQACDHEFLVCMSSSVQTRLRRMTIQAAVGADVAQQQLADLIRDHSLSYGDPPNTNCCAAGPTMNSVPKQVLQYWRRLPTPHFRWQRDPELEIEIKCAWAEDDS